MKILLLAHNRLSKEWLMKYNWCHELFRRELGRQADVLFWGIGYENYDKSLLTISQVIKKYGKPDVIFTHYDYRYLTPGIELIPNDILKVHYSGDYYEDWPRHYRKYNEHFKEWKYDIIFAPVTRMKETMERNRIADNIFFLPWSVDINKYYDYGLERDIDVAAIYSNDRNLYPSRKDVQRELQWKENGWKAFTDRVIWDEYVKKINQSKIFVTCDNRQQSVTNKITEVLACNTLLITTKAADFRKLGYLMEKHLVYWEDPAELRKKINYYLKNEDERLKIAKNGMEFVRKYHSTEVRVKEMLEKIEEVRNNGGNRN